MSENTGRTIFVVPRIGPHLAAGFMASVLIMGASSAGAETARTSHLEVAPFQIAQAPQGGGGREGTNRDAEQRRTQRAREGNENRGGRGQPGRERGQNNRATPGGDRGGRREAAPQRPNPVQAAPQRQRPPQTQPTPQRVDRTRNPFGQQLRPRDNRPNDQERRAAPRVPDRNTGDRDRRPGGPFGQQVQPRDNRPNDQERRAAPRVPDRNSADRDRRTGGVNVREGNRNSRADRVRERNQPNWREGSRERFERRRRERSKPEVVRRNDSLWVARRRIRGRDGQIGFANSRRYWVRDRRYGNRFDRRGRSLYWLPPVVAGAAILGASAYYLSSADASYDDYVTTFSAPPVRRLSRRYTLEEVISDPEVRSAVRSVDLNVIKFASGSDEIPEGQLSKLEHLADAILETLSQRPDEIFLIEGHTDAVGQDEENIELSERRAAAVQEALISEYGVPAKNLESVGYGEQYLFIDTDQAEVRNRRVVVRAIGALLSENRDR